MENKEFNAHTEPQATDETVSLPPKITKENIDPHAGSKRSTILQWVRAILYTLLSSLLVALAAYSLIEPNNFTIGGITGIAILLKAAFGWQQSITVICLNAPLIILSFFFVKKRFALLTTLNIAMQSIWLMFIENLFPDFQIAFSVPAERIFAAIAAGLCIGVAIVLAFKVGGRPGGADIVAVIIQKKLAAGSIAWILFIINCLVIGASFFVFYDANPTGEGMTTANVLAYNLLPIMLSIFESYIESKTNESMTNGFQSAIEFRIVTDKPEEIATAVMKEISRGVTGLPAKGMYTKLEHSMLVCVVSRRQVNTIKRIMHEIDPDAFAVMSNVSQVLGLGFYRSEQ